MDFFKCYEDNSCFIGNAAGNFLEGYAICPVGSLQINFSRNSTKAKLTGSFQFIWSYGALHTNL
jgi:hypothetical protein